MFYILIYNLQVPVARGRCDGYAESREMNYPRQGSGDYASCERERFPVGKLPVEHLTNEQEQLQGRQAPLYENIEYYPQQPQSHLPYYHPVESRKSMASPRGSVAGESYEAAFRKAQPQVLTALAIATANYFMQL